MKTRPNIRRFLEEFLIDGNANINSLMAPKEASEITSCTKSSDISSRLKPPKVAQKGSILFGQKTILREAIEDLKSEYLQMNTNVSNFLSVKIIVNEFFYIKGELLHETLGTTCNDFKAINELQSEYRQMNNKTNNDKTVTRRLLEEFAKRLSLRSAKKRSLKKNTPTNGKPKCGVCDELAKFKGWTAPYCNACRAFYRNTTNSNKKFVCENGGNCLITRTKTKSSTYCRGCSWRRCREVIEKPVDSSDPPIGQQSASSSTIGLNSCDNPNEEDNIEVYIGNSGYVANTSPNIDSTPVRSSTHFCQVCSQQLTRAQMNHGVVSCDGCALFFSRVERKQLNAKECVNSGDCIIAPHTRTKCQSCRYKACLSAGMSLLSAERTDVGQTQELDGNHNKEQLEEEEVVQGMPVLSSEVRCLPVWTTRPTLWAEIKR